ncbi:single-stranded DNA-binding protein [Sneathiella glossodoripedis]|uniref:single-stranded DNA-binding protein n=1 Tax=Sneathiella glossodoripedis TaxID=418853 RepID=UPI000471ACD4|nr:single-stranded DNA-binding protein [Sneathiella glossodoripedis]
MAGSINKVILVGNLCADVERRTMQNGKPVCNLRVATSESWKDKDTGERKERPEFHRVVIFSEGLCRVAEAYLKKGSKVYLEGQIQTRTYEQEGLTKYATEIVLQGFNANLTLLDSPNSGRTYDGNDSGEPAGGFGGGGFGDDIPFAPVKLI